MKENAVRITPENLETAISSAAEAAISFCCGTVTYSLTLPLEELSLDRLIDQILAITLKYCNGNKSKAAKMLGIPRKTYYRS